MANAAKIEAFIKDCFKEYSIDIKEYLYYDFDGNGNLEEIVWTDENGEIYSGIIDFLGEILGMDAVDILSTKENALIKWPQKYPYIWHINPFNEAYRKTFFKKESYDAFRFLEAIFDIDQTEYMAKRYNYQNIKNRMIELLKEIEIHMPGTFHYNADITNLRINTENFCSFDEIEEMTESFIKMINTAQRSFLKIVNNNSLSKEEINEYNFLVTMLGLRDKYHVGGYLYYSNLLRVADVYKNVTLENIYEFVTFRKALSFKPWRCREFINDKKLVEKYLQAFPLGKREMREYSVKVSQFECSFIWSDAKPIVFSSEDEIELSSINKIFGEDDIPLEERAKEPTTIYVKKTLEELYGDDKTAEQLLEYCRPPKLGGIPTKVIIHSPDESVKRIQLLLGKIRKNNYVERVADENNRRYKYE